MIILYFFGLSLQCNSFLKKFFVNVERQFELKIKAIRLDNELEFIMKYFYKDTSIIHQCFCVETP